MPQTNHGSIEFLKFPDPQHPGDTSRMIKKWIRDSWSRRKIVTLQQKFAVVTGIFSSTVSAWSAYCAFPTGFDNTNCVMISLEVSTGNDWRIGEGTYTTAFVRLFASMDANGVRAYTSYNGLTGKNFRVTLMRTDI